LTSGSQRTPHGYVGTEEQTEIAGGLLAGIGCERAMATINLWGRRPLVVEFPFRDAVL
jgi:hypothetical protein